MRRRNLFSATGFCPLTCDRTAPYFSLASYCLFYVFSTIFENHLPPHDALRYLLFAARFVCCEVSRDERSSRSSVRSLVHPWCAAPQTVNKIRSNRTDLVCNTDLSNLTIRAQLAVCESSRDVPLYVRTLCAWWAIFAVKLSTHYFSYLIIGQSTWITVYRPLSTW